MGLPQVFCYVISSPIDAKHFSAVLNAIIWSVKK